MTEQETDSHRFGGFWRHLLVLAGLRRKLTTRAYSRNSSAWIGALALVVILGPAALAAGADTTATLHRMPPAGHEGFLRGVLSATQGIWLLLLLPGSAALLGRSLPSSVLRPFPVRPSVVVAAGMLGSLADVPLLLALPILFCAGAAVCAASGAGGWAWGIVGLTALLFATQTALLAQVIEQAGALFSRQRRTTVGLVAALLLAGAAVVVLPGMVRPNILVQEKVVLPPPAPVWLTVLPSGVAALTLGAVSRGAWGVAWLGLAGTAGYVALTFAAATRLLSVATLRESSTAGAVPDSRPTIPEVEETARAIAPGATRSDVATPVGQVLAVARNECRALLRDPGAHLPLRQPATLLFTVSYAWMATDLGQNYLQIAADLVSMAGVLFPVFWQVQLLTDRFGNDAGTASLLFAFPICRRRLLIGKNLASFALLLPMNAFLFTAIAMAAGKWEWLAVILPMLPVALLIGCIVGNPVSALAPFPIRRKGDGGAEPHRGLATLYAVVGAAVGFGIAGMRAAFQASLFWGLGTIVLLLALYVVSVVVSARILERRERAIVSTLDD